MGKYDEFDLDIKEVKANSSKGTARSTWGCVEKSIEISQFVTNALRCQSCGVCSAGGRSQCAPCTGSSKGSQARC